MMRNLSRVAKRQGRGVLNTAISQQKPSSNSLNTRLIDRTGEVTMLLDEMIISRSQVCGVGVLPKIRIPQAVLVFTILHNIMK